MENENKKEDFDMLKLRARITMEAEITKAEAEILVNAARPENGNN